MKRPGAKFICRVGCPPLSPRVDAIRGDAANFALCASGAAPRFHSLSFEECAPSEIIISRPHIQMRPFILRPVTALSFRFANAPADLERARERTRAEIVEIFQPRVSPFRMAFLCGQFCLIIRGAPVDLWRAHDTRKVNICTQ